MSSLDQVIDRRVNKDLACPGVQETAADLDKQISGMVGSPEDEAFPPFHRLPEVLQHPSALLLLPPHLKHFLHRLGSPEECLRTSRDIAIAAYEGALSQLGEARAVVCVLPTELMQVSLGFIYMAACML